MNNPTAWLGLVVPTLFVVTWVLVLTAAAWMSGWSRLAVAYRDGGPFDGHRVRYVSGELRGGPLFGLPCNYGLCLTLGSSPAGLHIAVTFPFRLAHPPLFIPWRDISARAERGWLTNYVTFSFDAVDPVRLRVNRRTAERLISAAENADTKLIDE